MVGTPAVEVVFGEADGVILGTGDVRGDLYGEVGAGAVLFREQPHGLAVEQFGYDGAMGAGDAEKDALADLAGKWVTLGVIQETADQGEVCCRGSLLRISF